MKFLQWFDMVYHKLQWLINFVFVYLKPIYLQLIAIIKKVNETNLEDDAARKAVFEKITQFIMANTASLHLPAYSDSVLNLCIEIVNQIYKQKKA